MKRKILQVAVFAILTLFVASIIVADSAVGSPQEIDGSSINLTANFFKRLDALKAGVTFAWGEHTTARMIETQSMLIRHTATKLQQQIAEQNARAYIARLAPEKQLQLKKKKVKYLAVPTVRSEETSPKAKEVLMIWDVPRETLASKNAYELSTTPKVGTLASYDDLVAEYIAKPSKNL